MNKIEFTDDLLTGNQNLDNQHRKLISIYNEFVSFVSEHGLNTSDTYSESHNILNKLITYTQIHFEYEEDLMTQMGYDDISNHKQLHADIVEKLSDYCIEIFNDKSVVADIVDFFENWVLNHIKKSDVEFMRAYQNKEKITGSTFHKNYMLQ